MPLSEESKDVLIYILSLMGGIQFVLHNQWAPFSSDGTPTADKMQYMYTFTSIIFKYLFSLWNIIIMFLSNITISHQFMHTDYIFK